ncbi:nuclear receptor-interacting protein 1 [Mantella aurantiaca]
MTHGEELSSEKQQDSIVLTYLEGLLMHQAAGGSGTVVDKLSVGRVKVEDNFKISGSVFSNCKNNASVHSDNQGSGVLHLKKARLLQSSEDWNAAKRRRLSNSISVNGKDDSLLTGVGENVPKGKQDSTLLASLLQSFSSRLQSVALTQQIKQNLKDQGFPINQEVVHEEKDDKCYGLASNHLKSLLNKSRSKDKIVENNLTVLSKNVLPEKKVEPPLSIQSAAKATGETISCAARLQAVANMVEKRSSPTVSPKPSVACSQLALLLSSEAHLQQYSREHALKAQSASQLASERLAAMARLKESSENDLSRFQLSTNVANNLNSHTRTITNGLNDPGNMSPFSSQLGVPNSPLKSVGYKNHTDKNHPKPSANSLLLHLLKSHNGSSVGKSHIHNKKYSLFEESATPTTTDDYSDNNPSFTEEESSDDESTHSNCAPIDLSFKSRADKPQSLHSASSIDNLTESLLKNWDPKVNGLDNSNESKDSSMDATLKPYQKVTLLQLLLGHKMDDNPTILDEARIMDDPRTQQKTADLSKFNLTPPVHLSESPNIHNSSPLNTLSLHRSTASASPLNLTHQPFSVKPNFPSYVSSVQPERIINPASKHLMELTRGKTIPPTTAPLTNDNAQTNAAFSASKLLQNLAQCGMQTVTPEEQRPPKPMSAVNPNAIGLIDRLNSPLTTNQSHTFDEGRGFSSPSTPFESRFPGSEIENLLERRTVLQLLLAAPNKCRSETLQKSIIKDEIIPDRTENLADEQIVAVRIKTEPEDDSSVHHAREANTPNTLGVYLQKTPRLSTEDVKSLHPAPHDFSVSKNGLLSRLLRQTNDVFDSCDLGLNSHHQESKQVEPKMSCIVPKKRKMHPNDPAESHVKIVKPNSPDIGNKQFCYTPCSSESSFLREEVNASKMDHDQKNLMVQNVFGENKNLGWSRESKGFNVLKQLLLSENCVRDSQHRNNVAVEELMRGNQSNLAGNSELILPSLNMFMGKPQQNSFGQMAFQYPSPLKTTPHSSPDILRNGSPRTEPGQISMCPNPNDKGPIKWVITDNEKNDRGKDSPRLTKTNPILYYMLQKGAHSAAGHNLRDQTGWTDSLLGQAAEMTLKRESSLHSPGTNAFGFSKPSSHNVNKTLHNSNGSKYGLFDMLSIKKEPE